MFNLFNSDKTNNSKKAIKGNPLFKNITVFCLIFTLTVPVKIIQAICISEIFIYLFSFFYAVLIYRSLKAEKNISDLKVASKEQIDVCFSVSNASFLPVPECYVDDTVNLYVYGNKNRNLITLRPGERKTIKYRILAKERGLFHTGPVKLKTSDPLGIFMVEKVIDAGSNILVRPARIKMSGKLIPGRPQGNLKIKNICFEDVTMRRSLREYKAGDELKRINWRMSAKYNQLYTNEYENTFEVPVFIFLNLAEDDYPLEQRPSRRECAIEIAAFLVENARKANQQCGFAAYGNDLYTQNDFPFLSPKNNQTDCILDILSLIQMAPGKLEYDPVTKFKSQLSQDTLFYVVGPDAVEHYIDLERANTADISTKRIQVERTL